MLIYHVCDFVGLNHKQSLSLIQFDFSTSNYYPKHVHLGCQSDFCPFESSMPSNIMKSSQYGHIKNDRLLGSRDKIMWHMSFGIYTEPISASQSWAIITKHDEHSSCFVIGWSLQSNSYAFVLSSTKARSWILWTVEWKTVFTTYLQWSNVVFVNPKRMWYKHCSSLSW